MKVFPIIVLLTSCTITVTPIPKGQHRMVGGKITVHRHIATRKKQMPPSTQKVDSKWLENYKNLETEKNYTIPADQKIQAYDGQFIVPQSVLDHYQDMIRAHPAPNPTP